jgi:hypothetical protein
MTGGKPGPVVATGIRDGHGTLSRMSAIAGGSARYAADAVNGLTLGVFPSEGHIGWIVKDTLGTSGFGFLDGDADTVEQGKRRAEKALQTVECRDGSYHLSARFKTEPEAIAWVEETTQ